MADLDLIVPLFDAYRQFYRQPSDPDRARRFLKERFEHNQSVIFLAFADGAAIGFTQLYPSFSSGAMEYSLMTTSRTSSLGFEEYASTWPTRILPVLRRTRKRAPFSVAMNHAHTLGLGS